MLSRCETCRLSSAGSRPPTEHAVFLQVGACLLSQLGDQLAHSASLQACEVLVRTLPIDGERERTDVIAERRFGDDEDVMRPVLRSISLISTSSRRTSLRATSLRLGASPPSGVPAIACRATGPVCSVSKLRRRHKGRRRN